MIIKNENVTSELSKRLIHINIRKPIENVIPDQFETKQFFIINELSKPIISEQIDRLTALICQFSLTVSFVRMALYGYSQFDQMQLHRHNDIYMRYQQYYKLETDLRMYSWEVLVAKVA